MTGPPAAMTVNRVKSVVRAERAFQDVSEETGSRYLVLADGSRYAVEPGKSASQRLGFERYAVRVSEGQTFKDDIELVSTRELLATQTPEAQAQLQWRISLPLMVPILMLIGLPLARVNPRQGRLRASAARPSSCISPTSAC